MNSSAYCKNSYFTKIKNMIRKILITIFLFATVVLYSQKKQLIGISVNSEVHSAGGMRVGFGVSFESQLSKHHGFELGLNYRNKIEGSYLISPVSGAINQLIDIREDYLSLPVLYKYYSNIVNISTGLTFDYFVAWKDISKFDNIELTSYTINPKLYVGWAFKVSKTIPLSSKLYLEPEIQFNPIFKYSYSYYGGSVKLKYKL